jgi:translocator protein
MLPTDPFYLALFWGAVFSIVLAVAGGLLTRLSPWYYALKQPSWKPPDWAFGPVWTTILSLLAGAIAYAWVAADEQGRKAILIAVAINGLLNMLWSALFFVMKRPALALVEVIVFWFSIVGIIFVLGSHSTLAGFMLAPYLLWVTIAAFLNYRIVQLNG